MIQILFGVFLIVGALVVAVMSDIRDRRAFCGSCCQPLDEKGVCKLGCAHPTANQPMEVVDA
ncbi:MAG: hypothetical protein A2538_02190 [Candidatus Magasanikbacteria bacterium RIFOXYD2_FULL_41_14]|uniref:Uncharacterized protein n=1 Tax=Candidatus Magasanikbacteria bacterium RIFOXYD2_FULL_41_14 TaxID=1798709 RepID=A0A1F6PD38_9BACT|nr:MAG: hypothetical protein A2538_02190 [Candidatus Magasanikbacteria bacterium RIFOXYD2_FULL_41_14]